MKYHPILIRLECLILAYTHEYVGFRGKKEPRF